MDRSSRVLVIESCSTADHFEPHGHTRSRRYEARRSRSLKCRVGAAGEYPTRSPATKTLPWPVKNGESADSAPLMRGATWKTNAGVSPE